MIKRNKKNSTSSLNRHRLRADIDECEAIPALCDGGQCVNTIGSFRCECPAGQERDEETNECREADECQQDGVCENGSCVNTDTGYYCICNKGFISSQDRKSCIGAFCPSKTFGGRRTGRRNFVDCWFLFDVVSDARRGNCFTTIGRNGQCRNKLSIKLTKKDCCCGTNMGKGWGDNGVCELCPIAGEGRMRKAHNNSYLVPKTDCEISIRIYCET